MKKVGTKVNQDRQHDGNKQGNKSNKCQTNKKLIRSVKSRIQI